MPENSDKLPIEDMTESEFQKFKELCLDHPLTPSVLAQIKMLFRIGQRGTARIRCDEAHSHEYKCIHYNKPISGIVERLLNELDKYKAIIKNTSSSLSKYNKD
jgi:hypothetical protein